MKKRKTIGRRGRSTTPSATPSLSTAQDNDHNATATLYNSDNDDDHQSTQVPDSIPQSEHIDSLDNGSCISCDQRDGALLVCTGTDCPISVHVSCIGSQPKFDDSGNFYCPYCWYKRTLNNTRQLKQKAIIAKKALSSFLDETQTARKDPGKEPVAEPVHDPVDRDEVSEPVDRDEVRVSDSEENEEDSDNDKGNVSVTGSSVSETKDSDCKPISVKKGNVERKVAKRPLLPEQNSGGGGDVVEEEVTSSMTRLAKQRAQKQMSLTGGRRKALLWTAEEEKVLKEGVLKFSKENQNMPWREILEFGCHVFDKTRTPMDLKDKWRNMSRKGRK